MGKQSAFAKAVQREVNIQLQLYGRNRMQLAEDAAFMAANEVLGLGPGRARAFGEAFVKYAKRITFRHLMKGMVGDNGKKRRLGGQKQSRRQLYSNR